LNRGYSWAILFPMKKLTSEQKVALFIAIAMILIHLSTLLAFYTGVSTIALSIAILMYFVRGMGITVGFHRYFSHKSYKTNRFFQFILAFWGSLANEGGVLWWCSHHRNHHQNSDKPEDLHSPISHSFFQSHLGWMWSASCIEKNKVRCNDLSKFPELKFLNKYYGAIVIGQMLFFALLGELLRPYGTNPLQMFIWGFCISTVANWHATFMVNSVCHVWGTQPYKSGDKSRNNLLVAILTHGEGWHNNHHMFGWSARNGLRWYQIDTSFYLLKTFAFFGIVKDLRIPQKSDQMLGKLPSLKAT
jgi:stearoyl-CoA desaturase (Delta-9 desaturase)